MESTNNLGLPDPLYSLAVHLHDTWRKSVDSDEPHMQVIAGQERNTNLPWSDLDVFTQMHFADVVVDGYNALVISQDMDDCVKYMHALFVRRNSGTKLPHDYAELSDIDRQRYVDILHTVKNIKENY